MTKFDFDPTTWVVWAVCHCKVSLSFCFWSLRHAHRSHHWTEFDDLYVIRRHSTKVCAFWGFCWYHFPLRGPKASKTKKGSWINILKPNVQNIKTCILSKLLHRIQPNFSKWQTTEYSSRLVQKSRKTNPIWRTAAILKNRNMVIISATFWTFSRKFGIMTQITILNF